MRALSSPAITLFALAVVLSAASCRSVVGKKEKKKDEDSAVEIGQMKLPVGSIHMIHPSGNFVLIRSSRFMNLEPGTELTSLNAAGMQSGRFLVSDARKGQFLTADLAAGHPSVGDQVVMDYAARFPNAGPEGSSREDDVQVLE